MRARLQNLKPIKILL
jgi:hypothetical protein